MPAHPGYPDLQAQLQAFPNAPQDPGAADWDPGRNYDRNDNFYQFSTRANWDLSDGVTLTSLGAYSHLNVFTPSDNDGTTLPNTFSIILGSIDTYTEEIRAFGGAGRQDRLRWILGANYEYDSTHDEQNLSLNATNTSTGPFRWNGLDNLGNQNVNTGAGFGGLDFKLTRSLIAQGSVA